MVDAVSNQWHLAREPIIVAPASGASRSTGGGNQTIAENDGNPSADEPSAAQLRAVALRSCSQCHPT
jgi:hypothetical protein